MNGVTLQALRRLLFFSVEEAARIVGGASPRAWQHWERGVRAVPADVRDSLLGLAAWRAHAVEQTLALIRDRSAELAGGAAPASLVLIWYATLDDWITLPDREPQFWRPHCSVVAEVAAAHPDIVGIITFNAVSYAAWLGHRKDTADLRALWASRAIDLEQNPS